MRQMKAVTLPKYGGPEVLEIRDVPTPEPAPGEVLVRVRSSALNRADLLQRQGRYPGPPGASVEIAGMEYAGEIARLGAGVTGWREGERVYGIVAAGAHAEYVAVAAATLARIPDALDWRAAGAVPEAYITAHDALVTQGGLRDGERVMVHAVGSGVGLAVVQVARALGARVFGTARTASKLGAATAEGMDGGVAVTDDLEAVVAAARAWSGGPGVDLVIDLVGGAYVPAGLAALAPRGRLVLVGLMAGVTATIPLGALLSKRLTLRGTVLRSRTVAEKAEATHLFADALGPLLARGILRPVIDSVFPMAEIRAAHERLGGNETVGKVVITVAD